MSRLSRDDQTSGLTVKRLGRVDSYDVSPFDSKFGLRHTGSTSPDLWPKTSFQKDRYGKYVLYSTRREAVSKVTLKRNVYVFLACSSPLQERRDQLYKRVNHVRRIGTTL